MMKVWLKVMQRYSLRENYPYSELFWSAFSRIRTEYGQILRISPYSVRMRENTDQKNSEYGKFFEWFLNISNSSIYMNHQYITVKIITYLNWERHKYFPRFNTAWRSRNLSRFPNFSGHYWTFPSHIY